MNTSAKMLLTLATTAFSVSACATSAVRSQASHNRIIEFRSGPEGFDTRTFFFESEFEVIAVDAQFTPALAEKSIQHLRTFTKKPITWLVITHPNPDKFNGASVFKQEGARIVASEATAKAIPEVHQYKKYYFVEMAKMFTNDNYPTPVAVDEVFKDELTISLRGGDKIKLKELNQPGISSNQTIAFIPSAQALFVGDLVHHRAHAWLEGGIVNGQPKPEVKNWIKILNGLKASLPNKAIVYGGRGETTNLKEAVKAQTKYLKVSEKIVADYIEDLGSRSQELKGPQAPEHYKALAKIFTEKFPGYNLNYMIEYGIYGLVNSMM